MSIRLSLLIPILIMIITACDTATPTIESTRGATAEAEITEDTNEPTATAMPTENLPAIELLAASPDTCAVTEAYSIVLGFDAMYYETTTNNRVTYRLIDAEDNVLVEDNTVGENKDGQEGWGFYPNAYAVPENSTLTVEISVYESEAADAARTSFSSLSYNCTTGETIVSSFERY